VSQRELHKLKLLLLIDFCYVLVIRYLIASSLSYGRPINGQKEIAAVKNPGPFSSHWRVKEGIFIHTNELSDFHSDVHSEL